MVMYCIGQRYVQYNTCVYIYNNTSCFLTDNWLVYIDKEWVEVWYWGSGDRSSGGSGAGGSGFKGRRILGGEIDFRCSRVRDCVLGTEGVGNRGGQVDKFEIERSMDWVSSAFISWTERWPPRWFDSWSRGRRARRTGWRGFGWWWRWWRRRGRPPAEQFYTLIQFRKMALPAVHEVIQWWYM